MKGWFREYYRHSLAARGIKTSFSRRSFADMPVRNVDDLIPRTRYVPLRGDKVIVVDLDNTLVDVVDSSSFLQEFAFIDQVGVDTYRRLSLESDAYSGDPEGVEQIIRAYNQYKSGQYADVVLQSGAKFIAFPRPALVDKLRSLAKGYRLVLFTASEPFYAEQILNKLGIRDLFEEVYARPFMDAIHAQDELIEEREGMKPITPVAEKLGVNRSDVILLDDTPSFVGPETLYRWVKAPQFFPDETQMEVFLGNIDRKLSEAEMFESKPFVSTGFWDSPPRVMSYQERLKRLDQMVPRVVYSQPPFDDSPKERDRSIHSEPLPFFMEDYDYDRDSDRDNFVKKFPGESPRVTKNYFRFRQNDPSEYDSYRTKVLPSGKKLVFGRKKSRSRNKKWELQSILVPVKGSGVKV